MSSYEQQRVGDANLLVDVAHGRESAWKGNKDFRRDPVSKKPSLMPGVQLPLMLHLSMPLYHTTHLWRVRFGMTLVPTCWRSGGHRHLVHACRVIDDELRVVD